MYQSAFNDLSGNSPITHGSASDRSLSDINELAGFDSENNSSRDIEESKVRRAQKWTVIYGGIMLVGSIIMVIYGLGYGIYDINEMARYNPEIYQSYSDPRPASRGGYREPNKAFTFKMDKMTYIFLIASSFALNLLTFTQGVIGIVSAIKTAW